MNSRTRAGLLDAVHSCERVGGLTHGFYRYPACISPLFARAVINAFTQQGDIVLDPFMGGGTTLVEACALGRYAIGCDINSLAVFVSRVKTTLFSKVDLLRLRRWADDLCDVLGLRNLCVRPTEWIELGYQRNISGKSTWPIRKTLELALAHVCELATERQQRFARCALLGTAQWALDCRTEIPSAKQFRRRLLQCSHEMIQGARDFSCALRANEKMSHRVGGSLALCLHRSAAGIETDRRIPSNPAPALILTSPPYPGVHVLYHRWQVHGRKETPAPFWIADCLDGNGESFYTFGNRKQPSLKCYYECLLDGFTSLAQIAGSRTIVVQIVAFSDPSWQISEYLHVMGQAGFREIKFPAMTNSEDGRLWRRVPNRKWYADQKGGIASSEEVILFHRLK